MNELYLNDFITDFGFPEESRETLVSSFRAVVSNAVSESFLNGVLRDYDVNMNCDFGIAMEKTRKMSEAAGITFTRETRWHLSPLRKFHGNTIKFSAYPTRSGKTPCTI